MALTQINALTALKVGHLQSSTSSQWIAGGLMREGMGSSRCGVELVVAVFDDWASLHAVLIETAATVRPAAVLHAQWAGWQESHRRVC
jgi:hypothetical protein